MPGIDVLCCDKTGTLTRNELAVTSVRSLPGFEPANVLGLAALASSDGGQDPVDAAIRAASARTKTAALPVLVTFVPFDPALKRSEATVRDAHGASLHVVKGAYSVIAGLAAGIIVRGRRGLTQSEGTAHPRRCGGTPGRSSSAGLIALSDPPRTQSGALQRRNSGLGRAHRDGTGTRRRRRGLGAP